MSGVNIAMHVRENFGREVFKPMSSIFCGQKLARARVRTWSQIPSRRSPI
jgi:hypothetical protein